MISLLDTCVPRFINMSFCEQVYLSILWGQANYNSYHTDRGSPQTILCASYLYSRFFFKKSSPPVVLWASPPLAVLLKMKIWDFIASYNQLLSDQWFQALYYADSPINCKNRFYIAKLSQAPAPALPAGWVSLNFSSFQLSSSLFTPFFMMHKLQKNHLSIIKRKQRNTIFLSMKLPLRDVWFLRYK